MSRATAPADTAQARAQTSASPATKTLGSMRWRTDVRAAARKEATTATAVFATAAQVEKPSNKLSKKKTRLDKARLTPPLLSSQTCVWKSPDPNRGTIRGAV